MGAVHPDMSNLDIKIMKVSTIITISIMTLAFIVKNERHCIIITNFYTASK